MSIKIIANNKKARHDYEIFETFEAGLVLQGAEVKSLRARRANINDSYCRFIKGELHLLNAHIGYLETVNYNFASCENNHVTVAGPNDNCPICKAPIVQHYTRVIGYFTPVSSWNKGRQKEHTERVFQTEIEPDIGISAPMLEKNTKNELSK